MAPFYTLGIPSSQAACCFLATPHSKQRLQEREGGRVRREKRGGSFGNQSAIHPPRSALTEGETNIWGGFIPLPALRGQANAVLSSREANWVVFSLEAPSDRDRVCSCVSVGARLATRRGWVCVCSPCSPHLEREICRDPGNRKRGARWCVLTNKTTQLSGRLSENSPVVSSSSSCARSVSAEPEEEEWQLRLPSFGGLGK